MRYLRFGLFSALLLVTVARAQSGAAKTEPAGWAPADSLVFIGVADVDQLWAAYQKTAAYEYAKESGDKGAGKSLDLPTVLLERGKKRLADALDTKPDQLKNPFRGALALFASAPADAKGEPQPGLVAGVGDHELMKKYYDLAVNKLKDAAGKHEAVTAGSLTIDVFTRETKDGDEDKHRHPVHPKRDDAGDDEAADEGSDEGVASLADKILDDLFSSEALPPTLALCLTKEKLLVASSAEAVKATLRRGDSGGEALATTEDYRALRRQFKPLGQVTLLVNLPKIFDLIKAGAEDETAKKTISALGLSAFRSVIGHLEFSGEDYDQKLEALALMSGDRTGLAKILSMENRPVAPADSVSAEAAVYASANINVGKLLDEIERIVRQINPDWADSMRSGMENVPTPDGEKMNLRKDVIDQFREPLTATLAVARPIGPDSVRFLATLGHRSKSSMEKLFSLLPQQFLAQRDVRGTTVFDIAMAGVSVAVTNDQLMLGTTPTIEAQLQTGKHEGLASDATFKKAAKLAPKEAWFTLYVDSRRMFGGLLELAQNRDKLEEAAMMNPGAQFALFLLMNFQSQFDPSKLDEAKKSLRYSAPRIITLSTTSDGVKCQALQLKPEKD